MDNKEYLTNKNFCPLPWTGFVYNPDGSVGNCTRSDGSLGNLNDNDIVDILNNEKNHSVKKLMLDGKPNPDCHHCYSKEYKKTSFDIISDRVFYLKELRDVNMDTYSNPDNFDLHKIDIRWSNACNFACVYCGPALSSKWADELNFTVAEPNPEHFVKMKEYIFNNAQKLKHVYLAGGEPLLMKENLELLNLLKTQNPNINLRVNTNLSHVNTPNFSKICEFNNVHWIISVEAIEDQYEYIRYGADWQAFLTNLKHIKRLNHKITFNMLHCVLNYDSLFDSVEYLQGLGFHNNSFVLSSLSSPGHLDVRHLPDSVLDSVADRIEKIISQKPNFLLEDGLRNVLQYMRKPFNKNSQLIIDELMLLDQRRNLNSRKTFKELYNLLERH